MNYDNGFKLSDMLSDEKYKARFFLIVFGAIFVILILLVRTTGGNTTNKNSNTVVNDHEQQTPVQTQTVTPSNEDLQNENSLYNRFSFLRLNNYQFDFNVKAGKDINIAGNRFDNKYNMKVTINNESFDYQARNNMVKVKAEGEWQTTDFPYVVLNYFDNDLLYYVILNSDKISDEENIVRYTISNEKLLNLLPNNVSANIYVEEKALNNGIVLTLNNNKIKKIDLNLTNLIKKTNELNELIISLEYSNIGQINDFSIDF